MTEVGQLGRGRAGVAGAVVAGPFDAGVVAGSLDDAGVGSVPAFRVEVLFLVMLAHDGREDAFLPFRGKGRRVSGPAADNADADTDTEVALDLLYGAAYHRLLNGHQPLNDTFARNVVEVIVNGLGGARPA